MILQQKMAKKNVRKNPFLNTNKIGWKNIWKYMVKFYCCYQIKCNFRKIKCINWSIKERKIVICA